MRKGIAFVVFVMFIVMFSAQGEAFLWFKDKKECNVVPEQLTAQVTELQQTVETLKGELATAQQQLAEANGMISALNEKLASAQPAVSAGDQVDPSANAGACCSAMGTDACCSKVAQDTAAAQ
jgi:molybdopterin converting factor small subunit